MPIQVIDVPSVWDAATQGAMHGFGIGASAVEDQKRLLQQQKATEIQQAIERDRLKQQADAQARLDDYRKGELAARQQENDARTQAAAEKAKQEAAKLQQADDTKTKTRAYLAKKYGDDSDAVGFFDATGQLHPSLPESPHYHAARGGSTDPEFTAIIGQHRRTKADWQAAQKELGQYSYAGKGDQLPSKTVPGAIRGKESEYTAAKKKADAAGAAFEQYDGMLDQWYKSRLSHPTPDNSDATAVPGGPTPAAGAVQQAPSLPAAGPMASPATALPQPPKVANPLAPAQAPAPQQPALQMMAKGDGTKPPSADLARQVMDRLIQQNPSVTREQLKAAYLQVMQGMGFRGDLPPQ